MDQSAIVGTVNVITTIPRENGYDFSLSSQLINGKSMDNVLSGNINMLTHKRNAGAPEQTVDEYVTSQDFFELNLKVGYTFKLELIDTGLEIFGGVKNVTNAYQDDFDSGKNRDSGYICGPGAPRTYYLGLRLRAL